MKVCIVAMGRSGGYRLGEWISTELNLTYYHEPTLNNIKVTEENRIVKYLLSEWNGMDTKPECDVLIGLVRENIRECAISHIKSKEIGNFRIPYEVSEEWLKGNVDKIKSEYSIIAGWKGRIESIKGAMILSYEGIYNRGNDIKRLLECLSIENPKYLHLLNPSNRLRRVSGMESKPLI